MREPGRAEDVVPHRDGGQPSASAAEGAGIKTSSKSGNKRFMGASSVAGDVFLTPLEPLEVPGPFAFGSSYGPRGRIGSYSQRAMVGPGRQERSWIRGAQAGSASDLEALFREHWPRAHRAAFLVVQDGAAAEDIAQEAFLAAVRNLDRFDRKRPFGPWLHRIVVNRAIDWARARDAAARDRRDGRRRRVRHGRPRHLLGGRRRRARVARSRSTAP